MLKSNKKIGNKSTVVWNQPEAVGDNEWTYGICGCCIDCSTFAKAVCCFPCALCCLFVDARELSFTPFMIPNGLAHLRAKIRGVYNIKGSALCDFCATFLCPCCSMIQIWNELKIQGETD